VSTVEDPQTEHDASDQSAGGSASVHVIPRQRSNEEILERIQMGEAYGAALLYDRFSPQVNRLVWRMLGADSEHDDLVQQVFCKLLCSARKLRDPDKLRSFVLQVTVNTVRSELRRRTVRRRFFTAEENFDRFEGQSVDPELRDLLERTFRVLEKMPVDERVAFTLRQVDGRSLEETAEICRCSLATIKRRINKAKRRFACLAAGDAVLSDRLQSSQGGGR